MARNVDSFFPGLEWSPAPEKKPANDNRRKAVIYARHSKTMANGRNALSSRRQVEFCRMYAEANDLDVVGVYLDESISGMTTIERNGWRRMVPDVVDGRATVVLVQDPSRVARDVSTVASDIDRIYAAGAEFHVVGSGSVTREVLFAAIVSAAAAAQLSRASTSIALYVRAKSGKVVGKAPYCYSKDPKETGAIQQVPEEVAVVRWAYSEVLRRGTAIGLPRDMNLAGLRRRGGELWTYANLVGTPQRPGTLRNPLNVGYLMWGKTKTLRCVGTGKPRKVKKSSRDWIVAPVPNAGFIPEEVYDAAQQIFGTSIPSKTGTGPKTFLRGLIKCSCGATMISRGKRGAGGGVDVACRAALLGAECDRDERVPRDKIEAAIMKEVAMLLEDSDLQARAEAKYRRERDRLKNLLEEGRRKDEADVRKHEREIESVMRVVRAGHLPKGLGYRDIEETEKKRVAALASAEEKAYELRFMEKSVSPIERVRGGLVDVGNLLDLEPGQVSPALHAAIAALIEIVEVDVDERRDRVMVTVKGTVNTKLVLPRRRVGRPPRTPDMIEPPRTAAAA